MEFFTSFCLFFKVQLFLFKEARKVRSLFPGFAPYEKAFKRAYRFRNPFAICRKFLQKRGGKSVHAYGETPLSVFAKISEECSLNSQDIVVELGCGRGKGVFFLSHLVGCRAIGIDWVPFFIETAQRVAQKAFPSLPVEFLCQEMHLSDFSRATVFYLYGTCLPDEEIIQLARKLESFPSAKIITVSYPLSDYSSRFSTVKQFNAIFPWGEAEVFLNVAKESLSSPLAESQK